MAQDWKAIIPRVEQLLDKVEGFLTASTAVIENPSELPPLSPSLVREDPVTGGGERGGVYRLSVAESTSNPCQTP